MPPEDVAQTREPDLGQVVARRVEARTWGRLRGLGVEVGPAGVVVRGRSPSYYYKQLALQGVREALGPRALPITLAIEVD